MRDGHQPLSAPASDALTIRTLHRHGGLMLAGDADWTTRNSLHAALDTLPVTGTGEIHLDLTRLRFIDVSCARELVAVSDRHPGGRLIVHCPPPALRRITAILGWEAGIEFTDKSMPGIREASRIAGRPDPGLPVRATEGEAPCRTSWS